jgi:TM2 domain-containing membrane protein YozV
MMKNAYFIFAMLCMMCTHRLAYAQSPMERIVGNIMFEQNDEGELKLKQRWANHENPRLVAIALDLTLGLFGMHRLYLGTDVKVPVAYTLTFGGGGILWIVDLVLLISSPDIESYKNNPHFFMWIPNASKQTSP